MLVQMLFFLRLQYLYDLNCYDHLILLTFGFAQQLKKNVNISKVTVLNVGGHSGQTGEIS